MLQHSQDIVIKTDANKKDQIQCERCYTKNIKQNETVYDLFPWNKRDAIIKDANGDTIFEQKDVEAPTFWSDQAINIVAQKYFAGKADSPGRETSVWVMVSRVVNRIRDWGVEQNYFTDTTSANVFRDELAFMLLNQMFSFNSPVWFNIGVEGVKQQASACFILDVNDSMESILEWYKEEGLIFKSGSGSGINLSKLRGSKEHLSGGGIASGPVSFMRGADASAGAIKSGGRTRRAAKMVVLDIDHPDIEDFIECKAREEEKARALRSVGFDVGMNGRDEATLSFQNANNSVRVTDDFMSCAVTDAKPWHLKNRADGSSCKELRAPELLGKIAKAAWACGDPGLQFDTTINVWNTCANSDRIEASNPCCFVGETLVETSDGKIPISVLETQARDDKKELPFVFAWDDEKNIPTLKPITKVWCSGSTNRLVRVTTDKGLSFICTPEHRFRLYDGTYVEAQHLEKGVRLRKINRTVNKQRNNRKMIMHRVTATAPNGCQYQARWMWEQIFGPIPADFDLHHINGDATDDRLSNLQLVCTKEHQTKHSTGLQNSRAIDVQLEDLQAVWETIECLPRLTHKKRLTHVTPARWNKYVQDNNLKGQIPLANGCGRIRGKSWYDFTQEMQSAGNDRVTSVEHVELPESVDVYDLQVDGTHNFSISSDKAEHGIVVHNSEFMFLNNTACNLASINLVEFQQGDGEIDTDHFTRAVSMIFTAMDILVTKADYPTAKIKINSNVYRPLGLGYTNLGSFLMRKGLAYDSDAARTEVSLITALMQGSCAITSARLASTLSPFVMYSANTDSMQNVIRMHAARASEVVKRVTNGTTPPLAKAVMAVWNEAQRLGSSYGYRNSQFTVIAPSGTISFMMDCDTTGIEPELALVKYKKLAGGGNIKIVNGSVRAALVALDYTDDVIDRAIKHVEQHNTLQTFNEITSEHKKVFHTALGAGDAILSWRAHIDMMSAVQPFISGAISKTVNMPTNATVEDMQDAYVYAWRKQLKAVALYRDGCKNSQPLTIKDDNAASIITQTRDRDRLPEERKAITHKFSIGGHDGYLTVGMYEDGRVGELFVRMAKEGSTISGLLDSFACAVSIGLQYGVPLALLIDKFSHSRFEPSGFSGNQEIGYAKSIIDYIFRWLDYKFQTKKTQKAASAPPQQLHEITVGETDAPLCYECGSLMARRGSCYSCVNCGTTTGCG